ncbi:hypothetical protein SDJN03_03587, partial [Cucurbita argyrosperma subsp. sororia]
MDVDEGVETRLSRRETASTSGLLLVEGLVLCVRDHDYDLSLFFRILDFLRGSAIFRRSDHIRRRVRSDFGMRWCTYW